MAPSQSFTAVHMCSGLAHFTSGQKLTACAGDGQKEPGIRRDSRLMSNYQRARWTDLRAAADRLRSGKRGGRQLLTELGAAWLLGRASRDCERSDERPCAACLACMARSVPESLTHDERAWDAACYARGLDLSAHWRSRRSS